MSRNGLVCWWRWVKGWFGCWNSMYKSLGVWKGHNMRPGWLLWEVETGVGENSLSKIHPPEQSDWARLTQLLKSKEDRVKGRRMKNEAESEGATAHFLCYHSPDPLARYSLAWGILPHRKVTWGGDVTACCFHQLTGVKASGDSKGSSEMRRGTLPGLHAQPSQIRLWHPKKKLLFHCCLLLMSTEWSRNSVILDLPTYFV